MATGSVTRWILDLNRGDGDVIEFLWKRYWRRLVRLADSGVDRLKVTSPGIDEDVAQLVFMQVWQKISQSDLPPRNRRELWKLMTTITYRKSVDFRRQERAMKRVAGEMPETIPATDAPDMQLALADDLDRLGELSGPMSKQIVVYILEGFDQQEIAQKLETSERTIQRKLALIRKVWRRHFDESS